MKPDALNIFIKKLFKILSLSKNNSIISWTDCGTSFVIKDLHQFSEVILPKYFKHKNLSSFIRKLNLYDFHKSSNKLFEFSHPLFTPTNLDSPNQIKKKPSSNPDTKEVINRLSNRFNTLQSQQVLMETMLETLEQQCSAMTEQNQLLINEILQKKQRETELFARLEKLNCKSPFESLKLSDSDPTD